MARVFVSGSSTGLGLMAGKLLVQQGHQVVLHARSKDRADSTKLELPEAEFVVVGDLSTIAGAKDLARQINDLGKFDAIIHNAAIGHQLTNDMTSDGLPHIFSVNTLSAYILTAMVKAPSRLVYLSSGMHLQAVFDSDDIMWRKRKWNGWAAYSESKLHVVMLAFAVARRCPRVLSNALSPGWVATRMGGPSATDNLDDGHRTQVWLATSDDVAAKTSGKYFFHLKATSPHPQSHDQIAQDRLLAICADLSGVEWPETTA